MPHGVCRLVTTKPWHDDGGGGVVGDAVRDGVRVGVFVLDNDDVGERVRVGVRVCVRVVEGDAVDVRVDDEDGVDVLEEDAVLVTDDDGVRVIELDAVCVGVDDIVIVEVPVIVIVIVLRCGQGHTRLRDDSNIVRTVIYSVCGGSALRSIQHAYLRCS